MSSVSQRISWLALGGLSSLTVWSLTDRTKPFRRSICYSDPVSPQFNAAHR